MARQKTAWDKLSMNERAQFIKLGLQHGLTDLNDIKGYYNLYSNGGSVVHKFDGEQIGQNQELNDPMSVTFTQAYPTGMTILDKQKQLENYNWYMQELERVGNAFSLEDASRWATNAATQYINPEFILPEVTVTASKQPIKKTTPITTTEVVPEVVPEDSTQAVNPSNSLFAVNENGPKWQDSYRVRQINGKTRDGSDIVPANTVTDIMKIAQDWATIAQQQHPSVTSEQVRQAVDNLQYQRAGTFHGTDFSSAWGWYDPITQTIVGSGQEVDAHELSHALRDQILGSMGASTDYEKSVLQQAYPIMQTNSPLQERIATNTQVREELLGRLGLTLEQFNQMIDNSELISNELLADVVSNSNAYIPTNFNNTSNPYISYSQATIKGSSPYNSGATTLAHAIETGQINDEVYKDYYYTNPKFLPETSELYKQWEEHKELLTNKYIQEVKKKYPKKLNRYSKRYQQYEQDIQNAKLKAQEAMQDWESSFIQQNEKEIRQLIQQQVDNYVPANSYFSPQNIDTLNALRKALKTIAYNNTNPFEVSNNTYLAALGGPLVHKKSGKEQGESSYIQVPSTTQTATPIYMNPLPYKYTPRQYDSGTITIDKTANIKDMLLQFNDSPFMGIIRLVDPTGLVSVPDAIIDLKQLYDTPTTERTVYDYVNGLASVASVIPGWSFVGDAVKVNNWKQGLDLAQKTLEKTFVSKLINWALDSKEYHDRKNKKSTGGPLYPFSFEKNPFLKTPVVRYDEGGHKQDASNPGGYTDEQLNKNYQIWKTYDPTGGLNFFNYIASQNSGNLARGEENEYWKEYLGLNSAVPLMNSNAYTEWDKQIEAQKTQNGELTSDFYGTTPRMDYNIQALADTLMLGNMVRNYEEYDKMYDLPHIETITQAYEQAKNILNNPNQWTFVDGEIPIGGYRYDSKTSETNPLGMLSHFGMKWVPEENALYMHDTYDFPNKVYKFTDIPMRPREMKIRSKINFDPTIGSWLLRSPVNYNTQIPVTVTK